MADFDVICVGSGINALVAAALLARARRRVLVLERNAYLGGALRTEELTRPGFVHDVYATSHALFLASPAYGQLREELERRGLEYVNGDLPAATLFPDGTSAFLSTSHDANVAHFERLAAGDGAAWEREVRDFDATADLTYDLLGSDLHSRAALLRGVQALRRLGPRGVAAWAGTALVSCRDWLEGAFVSPRVRGLLAPWVLHVQVGPEDAASGFATRVITRSIERRGSPLPRHGGARLVTALVGIVRDAGGEWRTESEVAEVLVRRGRAAGVRLAAGETLTAPAVIANVTPTQLYGRLLRGFSAPPFRYGRARMVIHMALSEPPRWQGDERLSRATTIHVTPGLDGVSRAVNEAVRGLLPGEGTITVSQPCAVDPSRAPAGAWILGLQLHELPYRVRGDAAGQLESPGGTWTEELRERYADRVQERLSRHAPNLESALLARVVLSPVDLERENPNWVCGDAAAGACTLDQNLFWRPGQRTPVRGLYLVGASTHPGPGLGAGSGFLAAQRLLRRLP